MRKDALRIGFIGDSFVNGTNEPECLGWAGRPTALARRRGYDVTCYNRGVRRETSGAISERRLMEAKQRLPDDCRHINAMRFSLKDRSGGPARALQGLSCRRHAMRIPSR
jgi:lysophospholipase L1-like esterase